MIAVLQIAPLECAGCMKKIEYELSQQKGIKSVHVFPKIAKVRVEFDPLKTNEEEIEEAMERLNYPVLSAITN